MGTNTLTDYSSTPVAQTPADRMDQYRNSLVTDVVPRNSSGAPQDEAGNLGTPTYKWNTINTKSINIDGTPFDPNNLITDANQIRSGATRSGSKQPLFLQADGSTNALDILATTTNLELTINGDAVTFDSDVTVSSLTTAPSANNTCDINNTDFSDQEFTKYVTVIDYDNAGSEITALDGEFAAFSVGSTEYFIAKIDDTNSQLKVYQRGFFFDSSNNPVTRVTLADNDTITLMQLVWIYADNSGTSASAGYTTPSYSATQPSSPSTNDYWFDLTSEEWKRYDGAAWQVVNRTLIGYAVCDDSNCVATRCLDFTKEYQSTNTLQLEKASDTTLQTISDFDNYIHVYGNNFYYNGRITWDMTSDLESGVTEASDTQYYFYITNDGDIKISDEVPNYYANRQGGYHPFHTWRFVARCLNDGSSNLSTQVIHFKHGERVKLESDSYVINPNGSTYLDVYAIGGGDGGGGGGSNGGDTVFNFDLTAEGANEDSAGSFSNADLGYDAYSSGVSTGGYPDEAFKHLLQLSNSGAVGAGNNGVNYGDGGGGIVDAGGPGGTSSIGGGGGGSAFKRYNAKNINYGIDVQIGAGGTGADSNGADGVCLIEYIK